MLHEAFSGVVGRVPRLVMRDVQTRLSEALGPEPAAQRKCVFAYLDELAFVAEASHLDTITGSASSYAPRQD